MLGDQRSSRFAQHFVEQWLGLERIDGVTHLKDQTLREAMLEEPVALFKEVLGTNRSVMDFLDCNYVMANERLAAHYRIPKVYGPHFRKVEVSPQTNRGGLLTCAAMLAINSDMSNSEVNVTSNAFFIGLIKLRRGVIRCALTLGTLVRIEWNCCCD